MKLSTTMLALTLLTTSASATEITGPSKQGSVGDQRMRLECGVGFRQLLKCRRTRSRQLWGH